MNNYGQQIIVQSCYAAGSTFCAACTCGVYNICHIYNICCVMLLYSHKENKDKKASGKQPPKLPTQKGLFDLREVCISNSASTMKFQGKSLLATSWHRIACITILSL